MQRTLCNWERPTQSISLLCKTGCESAAPVGEGGDVPTGSAAARELLEWMEAFVAPACGSAAPALGGASQGALFWFGGCEALLSLGF
jgi:hypothetical protein